MKDKITEAKELIAYWKTLYQEVFPSSCIYKQEHGDCPAKKDNEMLNEELMLLKDEPRRYKEYNQDLADDLTEAEREMVDLSDEVGDLKKEIRELINDKMKSKR